MRLHGPVDTFATPPHAPVNGVVRSCRSHRERALGTMSDVSDGDEIEREALRLNRRYLSEVVERFTLCPYAERSRREGQVRECVFQHESAEIFEPSLTAISALWDHAEVEVALFLYPLLDLGRLDFEHFVRRLRTLDTDRHEVGSAPFAMAAFHPDAEANLDDPERLIPFLRRSPYPTIQLVRRTALDRVRGRSDEGTAYWDLELLSSPSLQKPEPPPLRERIARANLATVLEVGVTTVEAVIRDILRDRDETRLRLRRPNPA